MCEIKPLLPKHSLSTKRRTKEKFFVSMLQVILERFLIIQYYERIITLYLLSIVGISNYGQDKSISEFDLYGRWVLELDKKGQFPEKLVYTRLTVSDSISNKNRIAISLMAFEKCEFASSRTRGYGYCGTQRGYVDKHTWVYDEKKEVIVITTVKTWLKEFSETHPEEYAEFDSLNWIEKHPL
ncbi:hypothetical protein MNBD_BACTEROID03-2640 [hydrothermal vent metagenome]|uniref:Uncharacterized protein n=1 Tax=hydrothermal vent metagenome TaxID=652676 RepID=A0A3B0T1U0_9ZZZZ